jgi:hypothetical protein
MYLLIIAPFLYIIIGIISSGYVYEKNYKDTLFYGPECFASGVFWPIVMSIIFAWPILSKVSRFLLNIGAFLANRKQIQSSKVRVKEVEKQIEDAAIAEVEETLAQGVISNTNHL